jgi:CheY-like chemotaxis protein
MTPSPLPDARALSLLRRRVPRMGVLVVDDEDAIRTTIAMVLEDEGYTVLEASNGAEALELLRAVDEPLVVLLDWMMPYVDGLDVLDAVVREPARLGRHAYVFMSGAFPAGLKQVAALPNTVRVSVLNKPFTITTLLKKVTDAAASIERFEQGLGADVTVG